MFSSFEVIALTEDAARDLLSLRINEYVKSEGIQFWRAEPQFQTRPIQIKDPLSLKWVEIPSYVAQAWVYVVEPTANEAA